ncbi:MAG: hypothetical protein CM1200mP22_26480 [Dehalococcoidia bacterium]|nr:MAG: hypothetical protein CM1200mP22_26480 [Dehalococcoidia bacterium]
MRSFSVTETLVIQQEVNRLRLILTNCHVIDCINPDPKTDATVVIQDGLSLRSGTTPWNSSSKMMWLTGGSISATRAMGCTRPPSAPSAGWNYHSPNHS